MDASNISNVSTVSANMDDVIGGMTLRVIVTGQRRFRARVAMGLVVMRFAAWIIRFGRIEVVRQ